MAKLNGTSLSSTPLSCKAIICMCLLAVQFGVQPIVTQRYTSKKIMKSTVIFTQELVKLTMSVSGIFFGKTSWSDVTSEWTFHSWIRHAFLPALIYLVQNTCSLIAYENLDGVTYNVLNQTKTLSAAVFCYLIMQKKQSPAQMAALLLLVISALVMEGVFTANLFLPSYWMSSDGNVDNDRSLSLRFSHGVVPIIAASLLSGLAGAISQKCLQESNRNTLLFTVELCTASIVILLGTWTGSEEGSLIRERGFFDEWELSTLIPIVTNSMGGILVGLVIKYAGVVRKGFALIFGILLSAVFQSVFDKDRSLSTNDVMGGLLAALSLWIHATNPYVAFVHQTEKEGIQTARIAAVSNGGKNAVCSRRKSRKED